MTLTMELTKHEAQVLVLAIATAIEKETHALQALKSEGRQLGISAAIAERTRYITDLDRIRKRLTSEN